MAEEGTQQGNQGQSQEGSTIQQGTGLQAVEWDKHIPQEMAQEKYWEPLKGKPLGDVLKGYGEAQKKFGSAVWIPKEDAKPEEWQKFYQKLGTPEKPEGYQFKRPALGENAAWDGELEKEFLTLAHSTGMNSKQVQTLMDFQARMVEKQLQGLATQRDATKVALKKEWGADFERKLALAGRAKAFLQERAGIKDEEANAFFDGQGAGDNPVILKIFHQLGEIFAEDGWVKGDGIPGSGKQAALEKIAAIQGDKTHPFWNDGPGHKEALKEWEQLHKQAYK